MKKNITFLLFSVTTVVLGINLHVSTVSASEDIPEEQTTLLDIENENSNSEDYIIYDSSESDGIITENVRNTREIATFVDKWFYMYPNFVNKKPEPKVKKRWHVEYRKGWKFQGWLNWTGEYGTIGRFQTNFRFTGKLVKVD